MTRSLLTLTQRTRTKKRDAHPQHTTTELLQKNAELQLVAAFNSIGVAMLNVDSTGIIRLYNAALVELLDTNEEVTGKNINDILPLQTSDGTVLYPMTLTTKRLRVRNDDSTFTNKNDEVVRLGILITPIHNTYNNIEGYIFVIEDITKEKSLEEERDEFISVVSHELRTPITIAEGSISNAQLLLDRGSDVTKLKNVFEEAHEQVLYLANMVNDLSTLSRAERGVGDVTELVDIDTLAHELYTKYTPRAERKGLRFDLDIVGRIGTITTSPLYLEEILQNFITNSIKYTYEGSVTLNIRKHADHVLFAVKDTGIGISKSDQKRIFEKFYRSEDYHTRETSGTGLGLYVVQKLAHKLRTDIIVESRLNHGSTFRFTLPVNTHHATTPHDKPVASTATV